MNKIGDRIAHIRGEESRDLFAERVDFAKNTIGNYERGDRLPKADFLAKLHEQGWNLNWVVTGEGPERLADLLPVAPTDWDPELLRQVIEGVEEALAITSREMDPPHKAELIMLLYDMYAEAAVPPSTAKIIKLVRTTA